MDQTIETMVLGLYLMSEQLILKQITVDTFKPTDHIIMWQSFDPLCSSKNILFNKH